MDEFQKKNLAWAAIADQLADNLEEVNQKVRLGQERSRRDRFYQLSNTLDGIANNIDDSITALRAHATAIRPREGD